MLIHYKGAYGADVLSEGGMNQEQFVAAICGELPWFVTGKRMLFTFRSWTACVARGGVTHVFLQGNGPQGENVQRDVRLV